MGYSMPEECLSCDVRNVEHSVMYCSHRQHAKVVPSQPRIEKLPGNEKITRYIYGTDK